jgi:osmotically-inducible protein OsmY
MDRRTGEFSAARSTERPFHHEKPLQVEEVRMKSGTTDKTIEGSVMRELEWDPRVEATRIGVTAKDGAVVLSGHADSYAEGVGAVRAAERTAEVRHGYVTLRGTVERSHQREAAERPLEQLRGVFGVNNEITIKAPRGRRRGTGSPSGPEDG